MLACDGEDIERRQVSRLAPRFHIGAERLRRRRERDAKALQPLFGADCL